jgi:hypothetical protein
MTAAARGCACRACVADSLRRALAQIKRGRPGVAADICIQAIASLITVEDQPTCKRGQRIRAELLALRSRRT